MTRIGPSLTAFVSTDGVTWQLIGTHDVGFTPTMIGLITSNGDQPVGEIPADFDYFVMEYNTISNFLPIVVR